MYSWPCVRQCHMIYPLHKFMGTGDFVIRAFAYPWFYFSITRIIHSAAMIESIAQVH